MTLFKGAQLEVADDGKVVIRVNPENAQQAEDGSFVFPQQRLVLLFENSYFMKAWADISTIGAITTIVETGDAVVVLPYRRTGDGWKVILLEQYRPEVDAWGLKTVGGYKRPDETFEECAQRNCLEKLGIKARTLRLLGTTLGYSVARSSIRCYGTDDWMEEQEPGKDCRRVPMSLGEAKQKANANEVLDDSTTIPIYLLALALRNQ